MRIFCESTPELHRWLKRILSKGMVRDVYRGRGGFFIEFAVPGGFLIEFAVKP